MESKNQEREFQTLLRSFATAMLVTHSKNGELRGRPMSVASVEDDGDLWFTTGVNSTKADELLADPRVVVVFEDGTKHVSVSGNARLLVNRDKAEELWSEAWRPWFPGGPDDPELCLVHVRSQEAEYWDMSGLRGIRYLFDAVKHVVKGERMGDDPDKSHHAKVALS
jgi:general stress protein 26